MPSPLPAVVSTDVERVRPVGTERPQAPCRALRWRKGTASVVFAGLPPPRAPHVALALKFPCHAAKRTGVMRRSAVVFGSTMAPASALPPPACRGYFQIPFSSTRNVSGGMLFES